MDIDIFAKDTSDYIIYQVQPGDTYKSIAEMFDITLEELEKNHNAVCTIHHKIYPKLTNPVKLYWNIPKIYIKKKPPKKEELIPDLSVVEKPFKYQIELTQKFIANGNTFVDSKTDIVWEYKILQITGDNIIVNIRLISHQVKNPIPATADLLKFASLFNAPTDNLIIELDTEGTMIKVLNQEEIVRKWLFLRNDSLADYAQQEELQGIFIAGDNEFSNTLLSLQTNLLHFFFFDKVYKKKLTKTSYETLPLELYSNLFQGTKLSFKGSKTTEEKEDRFLVKNNFNFIENRDLELDNKYKISYKQITGKEFEYHYHINSQAEYAIESGILQQLAIESEEYANKNLYYQTQYNIKLLK